MSTLEPPGELTLGAAAPATLQSGGTPPSASPGVGLGATRVPQAPTGPEPDAANLTLLVSRLANELFQAPPSAPAATAPPSLPSADGSPPAVSPAGLPASPASSSSPSPPARAPSPPSASPPPLSSSSSSSSPHPFLSPLNFADLEHAGLGHGLPGQAPQVPLFNQTFTGPFDAPPPQPAPPHAPHASSPTPAFPSSSSFQVDVLELPPLGDRSRGGLFDAASLREEFPTLSERVHGKRLVWLDNAATTQKPRVVIERLKTFYERENSNIHRAAHTLAARATDAYEGARESVRRFLNASTVRDVVFVRGATEGINLVAKSWGRRHVAAGDEIVVTTLEHHANIVPWQMLCAEVGARLRVAPVDDRGQIVFDEYVRLLNDRTKIVSLTQVSNALGTITPAQQMVEAAHRFGARVLVDGAQSVSHMRVDVQRLGADFFVFSGHKVFGPTGIGAVIAPAALLDETPPWQGGGNMIQDVTFERTVFQPAPARFEAGTGNIADAVGLGAALDWLTRVGIENVEAHEHGLLLYGTERLLTVPGLRIIGTAAEKAGVLSFVIDGHNTQTVSAALDKEGVAVRGGHHCAQPILRRMGLESTVRASLAPYNTTEDLDVLVDALHRIVHRGAS